MPQYKANAYLAHKNKIVRPGDTVELTKGQGNLLGDRVTLISESKKGAPKKDKETK